jgi:ribosomal protein RSM22 (predicted rRNA methylase)
LSPGALERIERVARKLHGGPFSSAKLAEATSALSHVYTHERKQMASLPSDQSALLARAGFFFARDLPKVFGPLDELLACDVMPQPGRMRVLDVGAGLGATSVGLARWLRLRKRSVDAIEVVAVEQSAGALRAFEHFAQVFRELPDEFVPITLSAHEKDLRSVATEGKFDLALFGFVLNELFRELPERERAEQRAELIVQASKNLRAGGAVIVLEPALKDTARELMTLRDVLVARAAAPFVIAPCLHDQVCPMLPSVRDWCHQELAYALPENLAEVARAASLRYEGLSYASLVLANQPRPSVQARQVRVVSDRLRSKGKLELFSCSAAGYQRLTRLDRDESSDNRAFSEAARGDVLELTAEALRLGKDTTVTKRR